jgi:hypothetical protein
MEFSQHRFPADSFRIPKVPPLSADWGVIYSLDVAGNMLIGDSFLCLAFFASNRSGKTKQEQQNTRLEGNAAFHRTPPFSSDNKLGLSLGPPRTFLSLRALPRAEVHQCQAQLEMSPCLPRLKCPLFECWLPGSWSLLVFVFCLSCGGVPRLCQDDAPFTAVRPSGHLLPLQAWTLLGNRASLPIHARLLPTLDSRSVGNPKPSPRCREHSTPGSKHPPCQAHSFESGISVFRVGPARNVHSNASACKVHSSFQC